MKYRKLKIGVSCTLIFFAVALLEGYSSTRAEETKLDTSVSADLRPILDPSDPLTLDQRRALANSAYHKVRGKVFSAAVDSNNNN